MDTEQIKTAVEADVLPDEDRLTGRCRRLFLEARKLNECVAAGKEPERERLDKFRKELGKISVRSLTGDAMFYRGLAAEAYIPDRAAADWRALLRQTVWVRKTRENNPEWLIILGDCLIGAGFPLDACSAYRMLIGTVLDRDPGFLERLFYANLLCLSAQNAAIETVINSMKQTDFTLPSSLRQVLDIYEIISDAADSPTDHLKKLKSHFPSNDIPIPLTAAIRLLEHPATMNALDNYRAACGPHWQLQSPIFPKTVIASLLSVHCQNNNFQEALIVLEKTTRMQIEIPPEWHVYIHLGLTIQTALTGNIQKARCQKNPIAAGTGSKSFTPPPEVNIRQPGDLTQSKIKGTTHE